MLDHGARSLATTARVWLLRRVRPYDFRNCLPNRTFVFIEAHVGAILTAVIRSHLLTLFALLHAIHMCLCFVGFLHPRCYFLQTSPKMKDPSLGIRTFGFSRQSETDFIHSIAEIIPEISELIILLVRC